MQTVRVPKHVDEIIPFLILDFDEALVGVTIYGVGIVFNAGNYALGLAIVLIIWLRKYKTARLPGLLQHVLFWYGVTALNRVFRNGLQREWIR